MGVNNGDENRLKINKNPDLIRFQGVREAQLPMATQYLRQQF